MAEKPVFGTVPLEAPTPTADEVRRLMREYRQAMEATDLAEAEHDESVMEYAAHLRRNQAVSKAEWERRRRAVTELDRAREAELVAGRAALRAWEAASG